MENEKVKLNAPDFCKYLREIKQPYPNVIYSDEEYEVPVEDWEKWHQYHYEIIKKIEYLSSKSGKEQRKKDYKVVDFRTYCDIANEFPYNSNAFGRAGYVYADFPNSVIVGIKMTKYSRKGGYFHTVDEFMVLKSFYDKWKKEKGE